MIRDFICAIINFLEYPPLPELMRGAGIAVDEFSNWGILEI